MRKKWWYLFFGNNSSQKTLFSIVASQSVHRQCYNQLFKFISCWALFFYMMPGWSAAQITRSTVSSRYTSNGAYSNNFSDAFAGSVNQANLANVQQIHTGVFAERRFQLEALSFYQAGFVMPSKWGGFGLHLNYGGGTNYNNTQLGLAFGKKLGRAVNLGAQINYNNIRVPVYGSSSAVNFEIGSTWQITPQLVTGIHLYNPVGGKFGKESTEQLPAIYKLGAGYTINKQVIVTTELIKETNEPVTINAGLQYQWNDQFFGRAGVVTAFNQYYIGAGWQWKQLRIDVVGSFHNQLGFTPGLLLLFKAKNKTENPEEAL
jgi:hypothetical protein